MRVCDSYIKGFTRFFTVSKFLLKSIKQTKKERISDSNTVGQPQAEKLPTRKLRKRIIKLTILLLSERQSNHLLWTKTLPHFPSRLDVNMPFVHHDINQSARSTESKHHFKIQTSKFGVSRKKTQVELLQRMTVPVPKPPVFDRNILEYPKLENAFSSP